MLSLSTFVTRLSWVPAARSKAQFTCRAVCWSSVPTPKAHTTIPLLGRRRPSSSIAHQVGALRLPEKRCKSLATSRSTMRAPSRIWRKRIWRQSQLRSLSSDSEPTPSSGDWALERLSSGLWYRELHRVHKPQRDVSGGKDTEVLMDRL